MCLLLVYCVCELPVRTLGTGNNPNVIAFRLSTIIVVLYSSRDDRVTRLHMDLVSEGGVSHRLRSIKLTVEAAKSELRIRKLHEMRCVNHGPLVGR